MPLALDEVAPGGSRVVKWPFSSRKPCELPFITYDPTIWVRLLMPRAWVSSAFGTSIVMNCPLVRRNPCHFSAASVNAPTIWLRSLIPWALVPRPCGPVEPGTSIDVRVQDEDGG